jgi:hypothetical protein
MSSTRRAPNLATWQWNLYPLAHRARANLLIHALTVPLFWAGGVLVLASPVVSAWSALAGVLVMALAFGAQGRTHRLEAEKPVPFAGPADVLGRVFCEQWVTFPRYVLSGGFGRAWREGARGARTAAGSP